EPDYSDNGMARVSVPSGSRLLVYEKPSVNSAVAARLADGTVVYIHGVSGSWAAVSASGVKGYCNKNYLISQAEPTPAPTPV
ncbi:MAG: SH3 domain-containing protein, partial [Eubacteriales bacterium]|nr:SH3 domain-containing protein [Eubacteriales bacterium]